jgi:hypothetical protein
MVLADGSLHRRWGTWFRTDLSWRTRIEAWEYSDVSGFKFWLLFSDGALIILDDTLTERASFYSAAWDATALWTMDIEFINDEIWIADTSFRTRVVSFDPDADTFSLDPLAFDKTDDGLSLGVPFYLFPEGEDIGWSLTNYMTAEAGSASADGIATILGISGLDYDPEAGPGKMTTDADFFTDDMIDLHLGLLDGEVKIVSVIDARNATIKVVRNVSRALGDNPIWLRANSRVAEIAAFEHGLSVGDEVVIFGLSDESADKAKDVLDEAPHEPKSTDAEPSTDSGRFGSYFVVKVTDTDHFEVEGTAEKPDWVGLHGGVDVKIIPVGALKDIKEQVFSDHRGWPAAVCFHEQRVWLGGTPSLSSSAFGSRINEYRRFEPGVGDPGDGVTLYGVGGQARIRRMMSGFDLIIFADNGEFYVPGSTDRAITPETGRALKATRYGSAFTAPQELDGSIFFIDKSGSHLREFSAENRDADYVAPPATVVVPDWIKEPKHSALFQGADQETSRTLPSGRSPGLARSSWHLLKWIPESSG